MHLGMALEPAIVLGLVGIEIVENDMNFFFFVVGFYDAIYEMQEFPASPPSIAAGLNQTSDDV
jgi:hypothetical protein